MLLDRQNVHKHIRLTSLPPAAFVSRTAEETGGGIQLRSLNLQNTKWSSEYVLSILRAVYIMLCTRLSTYIIPLIGSTSTDSIAMYPGTNVYIPRSNGLHITKLYYNSIEYENGPEQGLENSLSWVLSESATHMVTVLIN